MIRLLFILLLFYPSFAWGALAIDAMGRSDNGATATSSISLNNGNGTGTFTCANDSTAMYVTVHIRETSTTATSVTAISYNGLTIGNATLAGTETTPNSGTLISSTRIYRLLPGAACDGAAHDLSVTLSQNVLAVLGVITFTGADQTTPNDGAVTSETAGIPSVTGACSSVTTEPGDIILATISQRNSGTTLASITNGTERWQDVTTSGAANSANIRGVGATGTGDGAVTITFNLSSTQEWTTVCLNINAAEEGGGVIPPPTLTDFRNQMSILANAGTSDATYVNVATQFGYEWVLGDPWSPAKAIAATNAGLKVMFNSNAERGGKWYNFENTGTKTAPANPTRVNLGNGYQTITSTLWNEIKANTCLTTAGLSMTYPTIYNGSSWMFSTYSISDSAIIPMPNLYKASSITGNVDANLRILTNHQTSAGKQIYHGLYFDEVKFPTTFAPNCQNAGNTGAGTVAGFDAGRKTFIAAMKTAFAAALPGYGGTSGNANRADQYDPEQSDATIFLDLVHSESSGGVACDTLTELIAGASTGCGTQDSTTFGVVDPENVQVQLAPTNLGGAPHWFEASYQGANLIMGRAAWQGIWGGWFGSVKFLYGSTYIPAAIYVIRAVPNWDNMVSATNRNWNESTDTYTSSNSRIDPTIVYSRHWRLQNKLFVVRNSGSPTIPLNAGENLVSAQCTDNFYQENANCTSHFSQAGTTVSFTGSAITGEGYVLYLQGAPVFQSATVSVANQLDVCFSGDGNAMLPATGSTGWTVTVAGVGKTPTSTSRQSNNCFRLVFAASTITTGTQTVTVAYTPGNITSSTGTPAAAFTAVTATNTLSGGSTAAVQTQTGSQLRHIEGDEIINAADKYGSENGNMFCRVGGKLRARLKIANTAAAAGSMSFPLYYDHDDGSYAPVTTSCATSDIIFTDAPAIPPDTVTTEQLTSDHAANVACKIIEAPGQEPVLTMAQDSETECEYAVQVCTGAPLGAMRLRAYKDNGSPLNAYTVSPRITALAGHSERHGSSMSGGNF